MARFALLNVCDVQSWCLPNVIIIVVSLASIVGLLITISRIALTSRLQEPSTPIKRQLSRLVLTLCVVDLLYYIPGFILTTDSDAPPFDVIMDSPFHVKSISKSIIYVIVRDAVGLVSVSWHCAIAWKMYSWIVPKPMHDVTVRWHLPAFMAISGAIAVARYFMFNQWHRAGVLAGVITQEVLQLSAIFLMLYYYLRAILKLRADVFGSGSGHHSPSVTQEGSNTSLASGQDGDMESGGGERKVEIRIGRMSGVDPTHRPVVLHDRDVEQHLFLIRRLLRISLAISLMWLTSTAANAFIWLYWLTLEASPPLAAFLVRVLSIMSVGLVDAVILGGLGNCRCSDNKPPSESASAPWTLNKSEVERVFRQMGWIR